MVDGLGYYDSSKTEMTGTGGDRGLTFVPPENYYWVDYLF